MAATNPILALQKRLLEGKAAIMASLGMTDKPAAAASPRRRRTERRSSSVRRSENAKVAAAVVRLASEHAAATAGPRKIKGANLKMAEAYLAEHGNANMRRRYTQRHGAGHRMRIEGKAYNPPSRPVTRSRRRKSA
jgi:hypothetical protein